MAGRFLPQKDVDLITRITKELVGDKKNNKDGIINQLVTIYKPSLSLSQTNMYGESDAGNKVYKDGVQMNCLINAEDFDYNQDDFSVDNRQNASFAFLRQSFIDSTLVLEIGDLIDWNYGYFEVGSINENQLIGGMFNQNYSVIATAFLVRKSSIQIERVRSI